MSQSKKQKTFKQMERHFKGAANHYRLGILLLVGQEPKISVEEVADRMGANLKTISQHLRYLVQTGLLDKQYRGRRVHNTLSPYGELFVDFVKKFRHK